ncbi:GDSL esterase/lipase At1g09390-like [Lolium perenne]|uniref:GDSL esterase/lipase At1g09390-like n=1 Tax=Lolium perenne TaxID=4522 RepID=UPI003A9958A1
MELTSSPASARLGPAVLRFLAVVALLTIAVVVATSRQLLPIISWWWCEVRHVQLRDSNSDTGGLAAGAGFRLHRPFGRRFFGRPSGRFSDGRLYIDFLCTSELRRLITRIHICMDLGESLGLDHLSPYLESSGVSFSHGANFAAAGAATAQTVDSGQFSLPTQLRQFRHFKARTAKLLPLGLGSGITEDEFQHALYSFDVGQNDISLAFTANLTQERILQAVVPAIAARIKNAVKKVYEAGGRKFVLYDTGPFGCLPSTLSQLGTRRGSGGGDGEEEEEVDDVGCLARHNAAAEALNARLRFLRRDLAAELPGATVVGVDMYAIKYGLVANHTAHGFSSPLTACCGAGGPPYNYQPGAACGTSKAKACPETDGDRYISWDGVHYTEAANRIVADKILSSEHNTPRLPLQQLCNQNT